VYITLLRTFYIYTLSLHDALPILIQPCLGWLEQFHLEYVRILKKTQNCVELETAWRFGGTVLREGPEAILCRRIAKRFQVQRSRSEEHTSELQSRSDLVCRLLLEK